MASANDTLLSEIQHSQNNDDINVNMPGTFKASSSSPPPISSRTSFHYPHAHRHPQLTTQLTTQQTIEAFDVRCKIECEI